MREIETDYLVVGAGTSGMAFVDALIAASDADVVMVDRRFRPGGHWLDAYPFVRLHQPSAYYGVNSRVLGNDRIDETGPNEGFYERSTAAEICDYFGRVLDEHMLPSGQVRFLGKSDYRGADDDGHHVVSLLSGEETVVKVRRRFVDATYVESSIPSKHTPSFQVDDGVRFIAPNDLVNLGESPSRFTVIGCGKTGMDTANWLMDEGVAPDRIRWIKPREAWLFDRYYMQPLDLVGQYMQMQARWVQSSAEAESGADFAHRMEEGGIFLRVDTDVEPDMFRGATVSMREIEALRQIESVVRGRVRRIAPTEVVLSDGTVPAGTDEVFIDCTARGVRPTPLRPVFETDRITLEYTTIGGVPWGAATVGVVEATRDDDAEKNRLCPPVRFSGDTADIPHISHAGITGLSARLAEPDLAAWNEASRLNAARGAGDHLDDPRVPEAFGVIGGHLMEALTNLERLAGTPSRATV